METVKVNIAVMDYASCEIRMFTACFNEDYQNSDVEAWLVAHDADFQEDTCDFMTTDAAINVYCCSDYDESLQFSYDDGAAE